MQYAKINDNRLEFPDPADFRGIPNWTSHEPLMRSRGWLPLVGEPESRDGYDAVPSAWHAVQQSEVNTEPRQYEEPIYEENPETHEMEIVGHRTAMRYTEIVLDKSYIQVDEWEYTPIPAPEPAPLTISKYAVKLACEKRGIWEQVRDAIEQAGKWESFVLIQSLDTSNAELQEAMPLLVQKFGQETVDAVLAESVIG